MDFYDALRHVTDSAGVSMRAASRAAGRDATFAGSAAARGSQPRTDTAAALLDACGWALVAMPADSIPDGAICIDPAPAPRR